MRTGISDRRQRTGRLDRADDAGVYKISDDLALIQTVDFFTPVVDDPYGFGQIAAANALSDVYAMGGTPKTAMNLVAFPAKEMDLSILRQIIQGGIDKLREAGVVLIGGHSIEDTETQVRPVGHRRRSPGAGADQEQSAAGRPADADQAAGHRDHQHRHQGGHGLGRTCRPRDPPDGRLEPGCGPDHGEFDVDACTDVTGFGLLGHLAEMVQRIGRRRADRIRAGAGHRRSPGVCRHGPHPGRGVQQQGVPANR